MVLLFKMMKMLLRFHFNHLFLCLSLRPEFLRRSNPPKPCWLRWIYSFLQFSWCSHPDSQEFQATSSLALYSKPLLWPEVFSTFQLSKRVKLTLLAVFQKILQLKLSFAFPLDGSCEAIIPSTFIRRKFLGEKTPHIRKCPRGSWYLKSIEEFPVFLCSLETSHMRLEPRYLPKLIFAF